MVKYRKYESMSGKGWRVDKLSEGNNLLQKNTFLQSQQHRSI